MLGLVLREQLFRPFNCLVPDGGWDTFKTVTSELKHKVIGKYDIFYFCGKNVTAGRELFNFDWWKFQ